MLEKKKIQKLGSLVIAKIWIAPDEDKDMYKGDIPYTCPVCHSPLKYEMNPNYIVSKKRSSVRFTYDGYCIVTQKFKDFCTLNNYPQLVFKEFPKSPGSYCLFPLGIFPLDPMRREVKFTKPCISCGGYEGIYGATPSYKANDFILPSNDFICCSDIAFREKRKRSPLIIVGLKTELKMRQFDLKGLCFDNVYE